MQNTPCPFFPPPTTPCQADICCSIYMDYFYTIMMMMIIIIRYPISLHRHTGGEDGGMLWSAPDIFLSKQFGGRHRQGILRRGHPTREYSSRYQDICPQEMQTLPGA